MGSETIEALLVNADKINSSTLVQKSTSITRACDTGVLWVSKCDILMNKGCDVRSMICTYTDRPAAIRSAASFLVSV